MKKFVSVLMRVGFSTLALGLIVSTQKFFSDKRNATSFLSCAILSVAAYDGEEEGYEFETSDGFKCVVNTDGERTVTILGKQDDSDVKLVIPTDVTNGATTYGVTRVGKEAFKNAGFTGVLVPSSVKEIGARAFMNTNLRYLVILGDALQTLGEDALAGTGLDNAADAVVYLTESLKGRQIFGNSGATIRNEMMRIIPGSTRIESLDYEITQDNKLKIFWRASENADKYVLAKETCDDDRVVLTGNFYEEIINSEMVNIKYSVNNLKIYSDESASEQNTFKTGITIEGPRSQITINVRAVNVVPFLHGEVTLSKCWARPGEKVELKVTPEPGYKLTNITLHSSEDMSNVIKSRDNVYTFVVPNETTNIMAEFSKIINLDSSTSAISYPRETQPAEHQKENSLNAELVPQKRELPDFVATSDNKSQTFVIFGALILSSITAFFTKNSRKYF